MARGHDVNDDSLWGESTQPSLIRRAGTSRPGASRDAAWRELVERYRRPITVCVRRHVGRHPDADSLVAEFFAYLFTENVLDRLDAEKGRFRAFMQGVVRNFVRARQRREARAGGSDHAFDLLAVDLPPDAEIEEERTWARALLDEATRELVDLRPRDGRMLLQHYGLGQGAPRDVAMLASENDLTPNAVHQALHRARATLKDSLQRRIRDLVGSQSDYETEKRALVGRLLEARPDLLG